MDACRSSLFTTVIHLSRLLISAGQKRSRSKLRRNLMGGRAFREVPLNANTSNLFGLRWKPERNAVVVFQKRHVILRCTTRCSRRAQSATRSGPRAGRPREGSSPKRAHWRIRFSGTSRSRFPREDARPRATDAAAVVPRGNKIVFFSMSVTAVREPRAIPATSSVRSTTSPARARFPRVCCRRVDNGYHVRSRPVVRR